MNRLTPFEWDDGVFLYHADDSVSDAAVRDAWNVWEQGTGIVAVSVPAQHAEVTITSGELNPLVAGQAYLDGDGAGEVISATVTLNKNGTNPGTLRHEIGHVLTLGHDDTGLMAQFRDTNEPSEVELNAVRELYGAEPVDPAFAAYADWADQFAAWADAFALPYLRSIADDFQTYAAAWAVGLDGG